MNSSLGIGGKGQLHQGAGKRAIITNSDFCAQTRQVTTELHVIKFGAAAASGLWIKFSFGIIRHDVFQASKSGFFPDF
ncbi:MAG: hypothetical protein ACTTJV_09810 [Ottowia sp.]